MIFCTLKPEKIWHEHLTGLSTSPVKCSYCTFGNPKTSFFQQYSSTNSHWSRAHGVRVALPGEWCCSEQEYRLLFATWWKPKTWNSSRNQLTHANSPDGASELVETHRKGRYSLMASAKTSLCSATTYADNVALPAFARRCCSNRSISPACRAHSSKPDPLPDPTQPGRWTFWKLNTLTAGVPGYIKKFNIHQRIFRLKR